MMKIFSSICSLPTKLLKRLIRKSTALASQISKEEDGKNEGI